MQLMAKPASAAVTEMKLLKPGERFVSRTITAADNSGRSKTYQGSKLIIFIARESRE